MSNEVLSQLPLGQKTEYIDQYDASLLCAVPRSLNRRLIHIDKAQPFYGFDVWNAYEVSWLNQKNKPQVALVEFIFPCDSGFLIESKSFKLYLNSFNNTVFRSSDEVVTRLQYDLSAACGAHIQLKLMPLSEVAGQKLTAFDGVCLDDLDVQCEFEKVTPECLQVEQEHVKETVFSDLLKSNCLVTGQPDWGSVQIQYEGQKINHETLLQYIVSFRNHNEFHEHCVERIFTDILNICKPKKLTVYARYTRRGGLDINPFRSSEPCLAPENIRFARQ